MVWATSTQPSALGRMILHHKQGVNTNCYSQYQNINISHVLHLTFDQQYRLENKVLFHITHLVDNTKCHHNYSYDLQEGNSYNPDSVIPDTHTQDCTDNQDEIAQNYLKELIHTAQ